MAKSLVVLTRDLEVAGTVYLTLLHHGYLNVLGVWSEEYQPHSRGCNSDHKGLNGEIPSPSPPALNVQHCGQAIVSLIGSVNPLFACGESLSYLEI